MSDFIVPAHTVAKFHRDGKRNPRGIVAAFKDLNGTVRIGWSLARKGDKFDKRTAWEVAFNRAFNGSNKFVPRSLIPIVDEIERRSVSYFRVSYDDVVVSEFDASKVE